MTAINKQKIVDGRLEFYRNWLRVMPMGERIGWKGKWVKDRIRFLTEASLSVMEDNCSGHVSTTAVSTTRALAAPTT